MVSSSRRFAFMKLKLFLAAAFAGALLAAAIPTAADDKPPAGLIATAATLDQVLAGYDKAKAAKLPTTSIEEGRVWWYGITGTYREVRSGDDYRLTLNLGSFSLSYGSIGGQRWWQNENGIVTLESETNQEDEIARSALSAHASNANKGLTLVGESENPPAYVIEVHASGGRHEWQYYDKTTFELVRNEEVYPSRRVITTYDQYRRTDGFTRAWHRRRTDGYSLNDQDYTATSINYNGAIADSELDIPQSNSNLVQFPEGSQSVPLPVRIFNGDVIVTVTINGRNLDFELDSGAGSLFIDSQVATELGLKKFGKSVELAGGEYEASEAIVPDLAIGPLHMKNVVVDSGPFNLPQNARMSIAGLLGFDLFAGVILKVDYKDGTLEAIPPYTFVPPADAIGVDAAWDDAIPRITALVGNVPGTFVVDSGAFDNLIFFSFAHAHADVVRDQGGGVIMRQNQGFYWARGIGGDFSVTPTQIKVFTIGPVSFNQYVMYEIPDSEYNNETYAGIVGQKLLSMFTVYFDYKDSHIYLIPTSKDLHPVQ
jgi:predicted aspartyl protease